MTPAAAQIMDRLPLAALVVLGAPAVLSVLLGADATDPAVTTLATQLAPWAAAVSVVDSVLGVLRRVVDHGLVIRLEQVTEVEGGEDGETQGLSAL